MGKKKLILTGFMLLFFMGIFCGCSRYSVPESENALESDSEKDSFTKAEEDSQIAYSMGHGAKKPNRNKDGEIQPFIYRGGEFSMEYTFNAEGKGKTIGFLLFVNGKPQPYRIDKNTKEEYCHIFPITDNKDEDFILHFTPKEGKKGETLQMVIVGIYHAGYLPDMKDTSGWGFYHSHTTEEYLLKMKADASGVAVAVPEKKMKGLKVEKQKVSRQFLKEELPEQGYPEVTTEMLEQGDYHSITYDGQPLFDYLNVKDKKKVHVVYKICGCSGLAYRTTFFINHQPVADTVDVKFSKGGMAVIEADIDIEALKENSAFYAITVPEFAGRHSEGDISLDVLKSNSILLYQKEQCTPVPTKDGKQGKGDFSTMKGKITEVFYGNDGNLLIQTEKEIYLYHVADQRVKAKMKVPNLRELSVKRLDGGYALVGETSRSEKKGGGMAVSSGSSAGQWRVWILDASLKQREKINLSKLMGGKKDAYNGECIAVSHAGRKIAVATEEEILLCDVQSKKRHQILDFTKKQVVNHLVMDGVNQIAFTKDDRKLALFSSVLPESAADGEESIAAWGTVSLDGKELEMSADAKYYGEEMCVYDDCLILPESFEHNSGRLMKVDMGSGKKSFIPFSDKREGKDGVYPSADGKYFATACLSGKSVTVRVYDVEKGKVLLKKTLKDKNENYFYRIPRIYLVDGAKTCVVVLGAGMEEVETKVEQFSWR